MFCPLSQGFHEKLPIQLSYSSNHQSVQGVDLFRKQDAYEK